MAVAGIELRREFEGVLRRSGSNLPAQPDHLPNP
jgi:hypothetical protein